MITAQTEATAICTTRAAARWRHVANLVVRKSRAVGAGVMVLVVILLVALFGVSIVLVAIRFDPIPWPI